MGRIIPNQNSWIAFSATRPASLAAPTVVEIAAATNITKFIISLNATAQGNAVPTPALRTPCSRLPCPATSQATFTGDFYRDDIADDAWTLLARGTAGTSSSPASAARDQKFAPPATQKLEVWPVRITTRAAGPMSSNTAQTFSITLQRPRTSCRGSRRHLEPSVAPTPDISTAPPAPAPGGRPL